MIGSAFRANLTRVIEPGKLRSWARRKSNRRGRGQDKSRKVRLVGRLLIVSKFKHSRNIAEIQHNFSLSPSGCSDTAFDTLRRFP